MPIELSYLVASVLLLSLHIGFDAISANLQYRLTDLAGSRDNLAPPNTLSARSKRATPNMIEGLAMFAPVVLVAEATGNLNDMTALGATLFFWGRVAYAPSYWLGLPWIRTLVWAVSMVGIFMVLSQVLPFAGAA